MTAKGMSEPDWALRPQKILFLTALRLGANSNGPGLLPAVSTCQASSVPEALRTHRPVDISDSRLLAASLDFGSTWFSKKCWIGE